MDYVRAGRTWTFGALPATVPTARFYRCLVRIGQARKAGHNPEMDVVVDLIEAIPPCVERSMRDHHTPEEIAEFLDGLEIDFGRPETLMVVADLNLLFMGRSPVAEEA